MSGPEMTFEEAKTHLMQRFVPETNEDAAALIKVIEAVNLQIRRRPFIGGKHGEIFRCPVCRDIVGSKNLKFRRIVINDRCKGCGQRIETLLEGTPDDNC